MTHVGAAAIRPGNLPLWLDRRAATVVAGLALAPVLAVNGGYFPTSWGWIAVGFGWAAALAVLLEGAPQVARVEWLFIGGLCALAAWTAASFAWSISPTQTALETQRILAFVAAALAVLVVVAPRHVHVLLGAAAFAATSVCLYALATRLFPDRIGTFDPIASYRLSTPIGYWNSLGLVATMAALLAASALGGAAGRLARVAASASLPMLAATLYFTFSRGAWIALFAGIAVLVAYERTRLLLIARVLPSAAVAAGSVLLASRERALTHLNASSTAATHEGHRFAALLIALVVVSAALALLADLAVRRIRSPAWLPRVATAALLLVLVAAIVLGSVRYGPPQTIPKHVYHAFIGSGPSTGGNLNARLFSLSGTGRWTQWKVGLHAFEAHPIAGIGAGGFERYWLQHRPIAGKIRDVHNLYLETLAEAGVIGFALLMAVLSAPFFVLRRARNTRLAAGALAAYAAYLVHAAVDWDWELSGVTLLALFCGASLLIAGRRDGERRTRPVLIVGIAAVAAVAGLIGLAGNIALARGGTAARAGNWGAAARDARRAETWAPWSAQPWQQLGEAELGAGNVRAAVQSFNTAIDKSPGDWSIWFDLARATTGRPQRVALDHAASLNPLSPEIAELRSEIAAEKTIQVTRQ